MVPQKIFLRLGAITVITLLAAGCATNMQQAQSNNDPLESFNRAVFELNSDLDRAVLKPVAETYDAIVPEPINNGVTNFFRNIEDVSIAANNLLQAKPAAAASDLGRFTLNTLVGFLGFFDVASDYGIPKHDEDFGQTLGYWGVPSGPYLVLPFFGPSNLRDATGQIFDMAASTAVYDSLTDVDEVLVSVGVINIIDKRADLLSAETILDSATTDPYSFLRNAYQQRREALVNDGKVPDSMKIKDDELFGDL